MRISDWSSDVCSSDLNGPPLLAGLFPRATGRRACHRRDDLQGAVAGLSEPSADSERRAADKRKAPTRDAFVDTGLATADQAASSCFSAASRSTCFSAISASTGDLASRTSSRALA